jgi:hypothetical protein
MFLFRKYPSLILFSFVFIQPLFSQDTGNDQTTKLNVFVDCDYRWCDFVFMRREMSFVHHVRDPKEADVHVLVRVQSNGGGGWTFSIEFIGLRKFSDINHSVPYSSFQTSTFDEVRKGLVHKIKLGLMPFVARTPAGEQIKISSTAAKATEATRAAKDPWDYWVFDVDVLGALSKEEQKSSFLYRGGVSADRVTEEWKFRSRIEVMYLRDRFNSGEAMLTSTSEEKELHGQMVKSLASHWSAGLFWDVTSSSEVNKNVEIGGAPAVEYSIFPYNVSDEKELTFAYFLGPSFVEYNEKTIFDKYEETLVRQALVLQLRATQPWGSAFFRVEGSNYMHDFEKRGLDCFGRYDVRLFKGLALRCSLGFEIIRNQLYLEKGDATLEEILLQRKQLATSYQLNASMGVSYTFGSIFNSVVNTRL